MPNNKRPLEAKGIDHNKLPVGTVIGSPLRGTFSALPIFGYVALREKTNVPLVMLTVLLLRGEEGKDLRPHGAMKIELPVYPETEDVIVHTLDKLGWDGRVWPNDDGWPTGEPQEGEISNMMDSAKLRATMTFPPKPEGVATMSVDVQRARGPFLMPPLEQPEGEVDATKRDKLRHLCETPQVFHSPAKPLICI